MTFPTLSLFNCLKALLTIHKFCIRTYNGLPNTRICHTPFITSIYPSLLIQNLKNLKDLLLSCTCVTNSTTMYKWSEIMPGWRNSTSKSGKLSSYSAFINTMSNLQLIPCVCLLLHVSTFSVISYPSILQHLHSYENQASETGEPVSHPLILESQESL